MTAENEAFLSRWARVKTQARQNGAQGNEAHRNEAHRNEDQRNEDQRNEAAAVPVAGNATEAAVAAPIVPATPNSDAVPPEDLPPLEALDGLASEYRGFLRPGVDDSLRRDALKRLFADPHFNIIDPFEAYSGDYTQGEPIDAAMMRTLEQAKGLLFDEQKDASSKFSDSPARVDQAADMPERTEAEAEPAQRRERDGDCVGSTLPGEIAVTRG